MSVELRAPTERTCELCGREEEWRDAAATWRVKRDDDDEPTTVGSLYCIHEWDIDGAFDPVLDAGPGAGTA